MTPADPKLSFIFRRDLKQAVTINAGKKVYFEGPLDEKAFAEAFGLPLGVKAERTAGEEAVSGFAGARKEVDQEIDFKKAKKTVTSTVWASDRLNLPLRVKTPEGQVLELRNIKEGKVDAALFELPQGLQEGGYPEGRAAERPLPGRRGLRPRFRPDRRARIDSDGAVTRSEGGGGILPQFDRGGTPLPQRTRKSVLTSPCRPCGPPRSP